MATVIGKTSEKIDDLLGDMVVSAQIIDGNLILTTRDGATMNAGGVGTTGSVLRLLYTAGAYPTRPVGVLNVEWVGPVQPPNMTSKDTWVQTG